MKKELHCIWLSSCEPTDCRGRDGRRIVLFQNGSPDIQAADVILELVRRHLPPSHTQAGGQP